MKPIICLTRISLLTLGIAFSPSIAQPAVSIQNIGADGEPLRGHFNTASGKISAIFLASPT